METKVCNKCKSDKVLTDYGIDKRNTDGLKSVCKLCLSEYKKQYSLLNKEKIDEYNKEYKKANPDKIKQYEKLRYVENKSKISSYSKQYKIINKERDRDKNNKTKREYKAKRMAIDPLYKLKINISGLIAISIKKRGYYKNTKTINILGCTPEFFKSYLESKWEAWMNWNNHGKYNGELNHGWDIDHIIPVSSATSEEEVLKLNHYTNLQPLCSYTNRYIKRHN